jgi:3-hydroxyacyl-CoA dehydrogenase
MSQQAGAAGGQRIATVTFENDIGVIAVSNPPVNTITAAVREGLSTAIDVITNMRNLRAVVLLCEGSTFFSGADIGEFSGPPKEAEYRALFAKLENLPMPVIAAMHGTVMGGGLEISLACHYRVAVPTARFALPEVTLGIIPGAGGTQRMPRIIGIEKTIELVLSGKPVDAAKAKELGFVDEIVTGDLRQGALEFARELLENHRGPRRTSEMRVDPATGTDEIITRLTAQARKQYPNREAGLTAIEAIRASARMPLQQGLEFEEQLANKSKATTEAKGSIHLFFAERETRKIPGLPPGTKAKKVASAGVIGSGTMGGGIAICFANAGIPVTLLDVSQEALDRGLGVVDKTYGSMVKRGRITEAEKTQRLALIEGSTDYGRLAQADVIIEAVFENMDLKKKIFGTLDGVAKPGAILATNTSTLDIEEIATAVKRPEDVIGMHFFSPANVMPLLEVVRTSKTSPEIIATVMDMSKPLRKTPVLSKVCYGFIGNRMMEGYAREAQRMLLEGATPRQVDSALEGFGMAMGILAVFDMAGVDVGVNVHKTNAHRYPPDPSYYQADIALYDAGRLGQKNGKGYYRYEPGDRTRHDDPAALELIGAKAKQVGVEPRTHTNEEIVERCIFPLLNEGIRILEEGVALRASDVDVVWAAGYGFPRYRGGPMFYADTIGLKTLLDGMLKYRAIFGPMHWEPAPLLVKLAAEGKSLAQWEREVLSSSPRG